MMGNALTFLAERLTAGFLRAVSNTLLLWRRYTIVERTGREGIYN